MAGQLVRFGVDLDQLGSIGIDWGCIRFGWFDLGVCSGRLRIDKESIGVYWGRLGSIGVGVVVVVGVVVPAPAPAQGLGLPDQARPATVACHA